MGNDLFLPNDPITEWCFAPFLTAEIHQIPVTSDFGRFFWWSERVHLKNLQIFPASHVVQALLRMVTGDHFSWSRLIALELCESEQKPEACLRLLEADELTLKPAAIV